MIKLKSSYCENIKTKSQVYNANCLELHDLSLDSVISGISFISTAKSYEHSTGARINAVVEKLYKQLQELRGDIHVLLFIADSVWQPNNRPTDRDLETSIDLLGDNKSPIFESLLNKLK